MTVIARTPTATVHTLLGDVTAMIRYHLTVGDKRTTARLDPLIADLLAIRLGACPQSPQARCTVRAWLQQQLDRNNDPGRVQVSRWLRHEALLFLVDPQLSETHLDWWLQH